MIVVICISFAVSQSANDSLYACVLKIFAKERVWEIDWQMVSAARSWWVGSMGRCKLKIQDWNRCCRFINPFYNLTSGTSGHCRHNQWEMHAEMPLQMWPVMKSSQAIISDSSLGLHKTHINLFVNAVNWRGATCATVDGCWMST